VSKSAMREPSNERYVVCTLYQEFTWPREWMTWLFQQFIVGRALAQAQGQLNHLRSKYWSIGPGKHSGTPCMHYKCIWIAKSHKCCTQKNCHFWP
jgi:hypothetical protein